MKVFLAKVKGNIISTQKNKYLLGHKLLLTQPVDFEGNFLGNKDLIALDIIDAGVGDTVIVCQEGDAIQQILRHNKAPVNTMIIGIVDNIEINE